ncbi:MAG: bifunctional diaminohydroxyphosphoribosylaminopyrimidine deaminase/5-amino-6-(5-phosphoribosylamino)uracil reductase RibD [Prosthecobacter sp.]|jgi:diaminohydroxyphosphoribosylaminopyrimidine deaminase/5-amino-6-(5-phosphoribosylamino)uracil reductase|nr:bifunctional diaminohydroxyphosphoribosylaminopyrimidine deaminase/5-amino-6-(5-phosphoribosylamino)uracil reductase RibD [Prosthecobacter sp.]
MSTSFALADLEWMRMALDQARLGVGLTSPNPAVGAVIVRDGKQIGQGWHRKAGGPHAEVEAIRDAQSRHPELLAGSTIYVTLEPCSTHGKTGPCTEAIRTAGIQRVVWGAQDPNPGHRGRAREVLEAAGIQTTVGVLEAECQALIRPFAKWITTGLPYVIAKAGQSLDGKITRPGGEGQWLTSEEARAHSRRLRARVDAILVGAGTVRADNPHLTLREAAMRGKEQPWRVVLTRSGDLPAEAVIFTDEFKERTLVLRGLSFVEALRDLAGRGVVSVLIEGGAGVLGQAFAERLVDEVAWYVAPRLCGAAGLSVLGQQPLAASVQLKDVQITPLGDNLCLTGRPKWAEAAALPPP